MIRIANARHNTISGATARLWLVREHETGEGLRMRRYSELELQRKENPVFVLSWTIFHVIDETSPLYGMSADDLLAADAAVALTVGGLDDISEQQLHARRSYSSDDIRWQQRYVDIMSTGPDGRLIIDYGKFHDVTPDQT
jgi:inward rectifier potassium channel